MNHTATPLMPVNAEYCELVDIYVSELCNIFWDMCQKHSHKIRYYGTA